jgi:hypothetical protein
LGISPQTVIAHLHEALGMKCFIRDGFLIP